MRVLVLGAGPAGLMAAHAAALGGHDVIIASKKRKSHLYGAQYLHAPIPMMTASEPVTVHYELWGTAQDYRRKVYGPHHRGSVSPEDLADTHQAWDIRQTYDALWATYSGFIVNVDLTEEDHVLNELVDELEPYVTFSTVPAYLLCAAEHTFHSQRVWAIGDAPDAGQWCPVRQAGPQHIICNGDREPGWYRNANVFDYTTVEYAMRPPLESAVEVAKPLETNCDCYPGIVRLGRYGRWQKGILSHTAFTMAQKCLAQKEKV